ncbi:hypothetical protein ACP26L_17170 [Paenibacillus sp. S-38]|uniref:hypothetical protein n=1 Tax=Paenibacillus sp. S-38 TaxID=3416710 RepID=UPI003CE82AB4
MNVLHAAEAEQVEEQRRDGCAKQAAVIGPPDERSALRDSRPEVRFLCMIVTLTASRDKINLTKY